ncbi:hypothetical protein ACWCWD_25350 [Streptomyces sp. NPDC001493]
MDYLYISVTNSTAFSPTDTMPLSSRAKLLMSVESIAALTTSLLVIARAVGVLTPRITRRVWAWLPIRQVPFGRNGRRTAAHGTPS